MSAKVEMTALALRKMMGENFDFELFEKGRRDAMDLFKKNPEIRQEKLEDIRKVLQNGDYRNKPGPEYWIGCMCEVDFYW